MIVSRHYAASMARDFQGITVRRLTSYQFTLVAQLRTILAGGLKNYRGCNPMRCWQLLSAVLFVSLSIPSLVHSQVVTMEAQSRSVVTGATANAGALFTDDDMDSAANFDPFNSLVMSTASSNNDPNFASANGEALQNSMIGLFLVEATGETNAFASRTAIGEALSDFSYTFTIDSPFFVTLQPSEAVLVAGNGGSFPVVR